MKEIIRAEIEKAKSFYSSKKNLHLSDDMAFSHILLKCYFNVEYPDQDDMVTDGANDGGIDFIYFDDDESKVVLCQSKCTSDLQLGAIITEIDKMYSTVVNFHRGLNYKKIK